MSKNNSKFKSSKRKPRNGNPDPPAVIVEPFNSLTLVYVNPVNDAWYLFTTILSTLNAQLGISLKDVVVKVKKIEAWGAAGGSTPIGLQVFSPIQSNDVEPDPLVTKLDHPGTNRRAYISYKFDNVSSNVPVRISDPGNNAYLFGTAGEVDLVHLQIVWRTANIKPSPTKIVVSH